MLLIILTIFIIIDTVISACYTRGKFGCSAMRREMYLCNTGKIFNEEPLL